MESYVDVKPIAMSLEEIRISEPLEKMGERCLDCRCIRVSPVQLLSLIYSSKSLLTQHHGTGRYTENN
jgi:hypothetical protein